MNEWLKPQIQESEAGMEVTSYLPAELDRAWASPDSPGSGALCLRKAAAPGGCRVRGYFNHSVCHACL